MKNKRYTLSKGNKLPVVPTECFDDLHRFLANLPENMRVLEDHVILNEEKMLIPFCMRGSEHAKQILHDSEPSSCLMDFTFKCCNAPLWDLSD